MRAGSFQPVEVEKAVESMAVMRQAAYFRLTGGPSPIVFDRSYFFEIGRTVKWLNGSEMALISTLTQTSWILEAADILKTVGILPLVLHAPALRPLDTDGIVAVAERIGLVVTADEHRLLGRLRCGTAEVMSEHPPTLDARVGIQ